MIESIGAEGVIVRLANRIAQLEVNLAVAQPQLEDELPEGRSGVGNGEELAGMLADDDGFSIAAVPDVPPKGEEDE